MIPASIRQLELSLTSAGLVPVGSDQQDPQPAPRRRQKLGWGMWAGAITIVLAALLGDWLEYRHLTAHGGDAAEGTSAAIEVKADLAAVGNASTADNALGRRGASSAALPPEQSGGKLAAATALPVIKVGVVHSLTGPMAPSERSMVDAFLMAFEEINAAGGLLGGRQIDVVVRDGKSNETVFAEQAEELIGVDGIYSRCATRSFATN